MKTNSGNVLYTSSFLTELWGMGHCTIGKLTYDSCQYVAKYITKKVTGDNAMEHYKSTHNITLEEVPILPEQARMSKNPAIGKRWIEKYYGDTFRDDYLIIDNKKKPVPKYYYKWIEKNNPDVYIQIKQKHEYCFKELDEDQKLMKYRTRLYQHKKYVSSTGEETKINGFDEAVCKHKQGVFEQLHKDRKEGKL